MSDLQDPRYLPSSYQYDSEQNQLTSSLPINYPIYHPNDQFRVKPLAITTFKKLDVDKLEDVFGSSAQEKRFPQENEINELTKNYEENDDIKAIKECINLTKFNKERSDQINDGYVPNMSQLVYNTWVDEKMIQNDEYERRFYTEKGYMKKEDRQQSKSKLQQQITDRSKTREDSNNEYDRDKQDIADMINKLFPEGKNQREEERKKKVLASKYMNQAHIPKEGFQINRKDELFQTDLEINHMEEVGKRNNNQKTNKTALKNEKNNIFNRLYIEISIVQAEKDYWEDIRNQLHLEEIERKNRIKDLEEKAKLQLKKESMLQLSINQIILKNQRNMEEKRLEEEFKKKLLKKFSEEEKEETDNPVNIKQREIELQNEIERQWVHKLYQYKLQKGKELNDLKMAKEKEKEIRLLIEKEKDLLIQENTALLRRYFAKGYYKSLSCINIFS